MKVNQFVSHTLHGLRMAAASLAVLQMSVVPVLAVPPTPAFGGLWDPGSDRSGRTTTPIKHVIVIIGENRSFDHVFATYVPRPGQTVHNLLSEGIIQLDANKNAIPGPNFRKAQQLSASDLGGQDSFLLSPPKQEFPARPTPRTGGRRPLRGARLLHTEFAVHDDCMRHHHRAMVRPPPSTSTRWPAPSRPRAVCRTASDANGLTYYQSLASGGTGQYSYTPDLRIVNFDNLPAGPFQLTNGTNSATPGYSLTYTDYTASPVHRFYQMWQQLNCSLEHASRENPSGCDGKLFSWVEATVGAGTNGLTQAKYAQGYYGPSFSEFFQYPTGYSATNPPTAAQWTANEYALYDSVPTTTGEGSTALGFYNVQQGDVPYFKSLADTYAMSDNFHQSVNGGTGANHIMLGHGDAIWFSDGNGHPATPPHNVAVTTDPAGYGGPGTIDEIENPNPAPGTNNWYTQDGYGDRLQRRLPDERLGQDPANGLPIIYGGGSYSNCSDPSQPGVGPILDYLESLHIDPRCEPGHYYLLNNYNPGCFGNGNNAYTDQNPSNTPFTIPPSSTPSIGDDLNDAKVSWKYYGDQWNNYVNDPVPAELRHQRPERGRVLQHLQSVPVRHLDHVEPGAGRGAYPGHGEPVRGHRQRHAARGFLRQAQRLRGRPSVLLEAGSVRGLREEDRRPGRGLADYTKDTVIFITEDEGGGYYDSGYVQPLDFFGDGTRIPLIVVANPQYLPLRAAGYISHQYADHVSILKFIERNWRLPPVTHRSRDNFPNPVQPEGSYAPVNTPALDDLFDFFDLPSSHGFF